MLPAGLTWDSMWDNLSGPPIPVRPEDGAGDMTLWVGLECPLAALVGSVRWGNHCPLPARLPHL